MRPWYSYWKPERLLSLWLVLAVGSTAVGSLTATAWLKSLGAWMLMPILIAGTIAVALLLLSRLTGWPWGRPRDVRGQPKDSGQTLD